MSDGPKMTRAAALPVTSWFVEQIAPFCERVEIAGSIRRMCDHVGDIEIVCIPIWNKDLIGNPIASRVNDRVIELDRNADLAVKVMGDKLARLQLLGDRDGWKVDLFSTTAEQWGLILAIRTGPAEFSKQMVTQKSKGGLLDDGYRVRDGHLWRRKWLQDQEVEGDVIPTLSELDFMRCCGGWREPKDR